jgi:DNA-binding transcriptional regulator GbsR (MarR family)
LENEQLSVEERFIERMGLLAENDDMPRISGRLLGLLLLEAGPFSFDQLVERLQVSRASISTNVRFLEDRGFLERTGRPGERQVYVRMTEDPFKGLVTAVLRRKRRWLEVAERTLDELPADAEGARGRLQTMKRFHEMIIETLEDITARWEAMRDAGEA